MDNSKIVPALLATIGSAIAGTKRSFSDDLELGVGDLKVKSAHATTDSQGDVLIVFLTNGQSIKVRATPFGRADK